MVSPYRAADSAIPSFDGKTTDEKFDSIASYLYLLNENLRYTISNLGSENFNDTSLSEIGEVIRRPLRLRIEEEGERLTALRATIDGLSLTVEDGDNSLKLSLKSGAAELSSANINLSGLVKFSDLEKSGSTVINGDNITTGSLTSVSIISADVKGSRFTGLLKGDGTYGGSIDFCYENYNKKVAGIYLDDEGRGDETDRKYRMYIYTGKTGDTAFSMKLESEAGISIEARDVLWMKSYSATIKADGAIKLDAAGGVYIGEQTLGEYIRSVIS